MKINITKEEFDEVVNSSKLEKEMEHFIEKLKHDYVHNTVVRSNVGNNLMINQFEVVYSHCNKSICELLM